MVFMLICTIVNFPVILFRNCVIVKAKVFLAFAFFIGAEYVYSQTEQKIRALVTDQVVPGVSYGFIHGQQTWSNYFGASQLVPEKHNLQFGQLYDLASLTKVVATTTLILKLQEQGRLAITDPVQKYLPEFGDNRVTLRHLLTHTSGITGYIPQRNQLAAPALTKALLGLQVGADFGRKVVYSDTGLIYLGWVIERLLKLPVQTALTREVLRPLQLNTMTFAPEKARCVPASFEPAGRGLIQGVVHDPKAYILGEHCASAGLFSDLADLLQFSRFMLGDFTVSQPPIKPATIASLYQDYTGFGGGRSLGWQLLRANDGHAVLYHTGFVGHFILLDGSTHNAFVFLSNRIHPTAPNTAYLARRDQIVATYLQETAARD